MASVLLFLPNALAVVVSVDWLPGALLLLEPDSEATSGYFWPVLFLLLPPSVAAAIIRIFRETIRSFRKSGKGPRRKLLFFGAIVMCIVPIFIALLLQRASPLFDRLVRREPPFDVIANIIVYGGLLSMPAAAIYAVAVLRVLEVRAFVGPLIERMARFLRRKEYDLEKTLAKVRNGDQVFDIVRLLRDAAEKVVRPESLAILLLDNRCFLPRDPRDDPTLYLELESLDTSLGATSSVRGLNVDLEDPDSVAGSIRGIEKEWLGQRNFVRLVPLFRSGDESSVNRRNNGPVLGLIVLGGKDSGLPYSEEDGLLLARLARVAAEAIEGQPAMECDGCGRMSRPEVASCLDCRDKDPAPVVRPAPVPYLLEGRFRFERRLGKGGMGVVYKVTDAFHGDLAFKTMRSLAGMSRVEAEEAKKLISEGVTQAKIKHPNVATIHDYKIWNERPMLMIELLEKGTLSARLKAAGPLPPDEAIELGITLAGALESIHAKGLFHRDIKPSNIGYSRDGVPKLIDFGLAEIMPIARVDNSADLEMDPDATQSVETINGSIVGTPAYMPPEYYTARPGVSFDLWALAMTLYECMTGRNPMQRDNLLETLRLVSREEVPDIRQNIKPCPEPVALLIERALAKEPSLRPDSAEDLRHRLEETRSVL